ncbi:hypothetical protein J14TS2_42110 [Bacillus sp. J14TS2]|uniref:IS3 family transposase n=1 Tax=Bacillus sp. J14TS2 TaxID=2807188 RepID=UPI001B18238C|nr:IS3 family transposase [Bacillus sp. J14TS2]GIN73736.1 hypothetical protein J14TS2_42110 [Bacillus sp. J14TS2]
MSRKVNCADNASMKNFFGIMKQEMFHGEELVKNYEKLKRRIEEYIYWYNNERMKLNLVGLSPVQYQTQSNQLSAS